MINLSANIDLVIVYYQDKPAFLRLYNTLWSYQTFFSLLDSYQAQSILEKQKSDGDLDFPKSWPQLMYYAFYKL